MSKLNATEMDIVTFREKVLPLLSGEDAASAERLLAAAELGLRSFDTVKAIRPLITAVWKGMCEGNDQNRFAVESMIKEIDSFLGFWIVDDGRGVRKKGG